MTTNAARLSIVQSAESPATLTLEGDLDASTATDLQAALDQVDPSSRVVIDLAGVSFIDSSGLRVLVQTHSRHQPPGGGLLLRAPSPTTVRLLEISGLLDHLQVELVSDPRTVLD